MIKPTRTLMAFSLLALTGCNGIGGGANPSSTLSKSSSQPGNDNVAAKFDGRSANLVHFRSGEPGLIFRNVEFKEIQHVITRNALWLGIDPITDGINITATRDGTAQPSLWLLAQHYLGAITHEKWGDFNFAVTGDLDFIRDGTSYSCPGIALSQYITRNSWLFLSNLAPGNAADAYHNTSTKISCINQDNGEATYFSVGGDDTNIFYLNKLTDDQQPTLADLIVDEFNHIPVAKRAQLFSNDVYKISAANQNAFFIYNPRQFNSDFVQTTDVTNELAGMENNVYLGLSPAINCSAILDTASTASFSKSYTTSLALSWGLSNTWEEGFEIAKDFSIGVQNTGSKVSLKLSLKHSATDSSSTTQTTSDTTSITVPSMTVNVPPLSKRVVQVSLAEIKVNGKLEVIHKIKGKLYVDGINFINAGDFMHSSFDRYNGYIDIYTAFAESTKPLPANVRLDPLTRTVNFIDAVAVDGTIPSTQVKLTTVLGEIMPLAPGDCSY